MIAVLVWRAKARRQPDFPAWSFGFALLVVFLLTKRMCEELQSAGVHRATARAVGHVGSELLLDGLLSTDAEARGAYARSLEPEVREPLAELLSLRGTMQPEELSALMARLSQAPLPEGYRDAAFVLERLRRILAPRPRLAFKPSDLEPTAAWLRKAQQTLHEQGTGWIDALL